jgi:hypothetical protein
VVVSRVLPGAKRSEGGATDERSPAIDGVDFTRYSEGEESEAQALQLRFCAIAGAAVLNAYPVQKRPASVPGARQLVDSPPPV